MTNLIVNLMLCRFNLLQFKITQCIERNYVHVPLLEVVIWVIVVELAEVLE